MTRQEYNEYRSIRASAKKYGLPTYGCQYTIRTNASEEYKVKLHKLYSEWGLHPASVRVDTHYFDDQERIIYIYGRTWKDDEGREYPWTSLYTYEERERFDRALHS